MKKELNNYAEFVKAVTSDPSLDANKLVARILELNETGVNIAQLMTGASGLSSESGEFQEIVKKLLYQGANLNEQSQFHMKRELGDIMFYWIEACISLGLDPYDVIDENIKKLQTRYPGGKFSIHHSENRSTDDI